MAIALLMAGSAAVDTSQLQSQLDYMVAICRAEGTTKLVADEGNRVEILSGKPGQIPTVSENKAIQCVFDRLKQRPELKLGFKGHEAAPESRKK